MATLTLKRLNNTFTIHSFPANSEIPSEVFKQHMYFIAKTNDEVSVVAPSTLMLLSEDSEPDWQALEVVGPLDFSLTGILSKISTILANKKISIFAISTFDTDYVLVKSNKIDSAITALTNNNYQVI
ncbi:ACT domain-containing protein [Thalassotalea hakodatensis]|uniref:ACT domain-containing protein n=1 Tax=Thalassotalea hakodatensis TaxID=3030492 RepID=UPI00257318FA|nr:ACT domain-containing protein [Thalassotalea hakodatensis]